MNRIRTALCLLVLAALVAPATSNAAIAARSFERATAHTSWHRVATKAPTGHEQLADAARSHRPVSLDRLLELQQAALADPPSKGGSGMRAVVPAAVRARLTRASAAPGASPTLSFPVAQIDADGDGLSDVLAGELDPASPSDTPLELVLRAGSDGHALWRIPASVWALVLLADLDGDARPELVLFDTAILSDRGRGGLLSSVDVVKVDQVVTVIDAGTGAKISSSSVTGRAIAVSAGLVGGGDVAAVTGLLNSLDPFAAGDGTSDLLATKVNLVFTDLFAVAAFGFGEAYRESAVRIARTTGAQTKGATTTGVNAFACVVIRCAEVPVSGRTIYAAPDLDGDREGDLLVASRKSVAAEAFDGKETFWKADTGTSPYGEFAQLNGTGPDDLVVYSLSGTAGFDGATGAPMWSLADSGLGSVELVADASGDGGADVLMVETTLDENFENETDKATMLSGADGSELWSRQIDPVASTPGGTAYLAQCGCASDLNADGAPDDLFAIVDYDEGGNYVSAAIFALSGRDGARLWTWSAFPDELSYPVPAGGDVNGDGSADLVEIRYGDGGSLGAQLSSGADAAALWSATLDTDDLSGYDDPFTDAFGFAANLVPAGADEMVFGTIAFVCGDTDCVQFAHTQAESPAGELWST